MKKTIFPFDFQLFVERLREDENKCDIIEPFEENFGSLKDRVYTDLPFYKEYLAKIEMDESLTKRIRVPEELIGCYDYNLLLKLVVCSFSSDYDFVYEDDTDTIKFMIMVENEKQNITKQLDELWSFQIVRLFEIYLEEQIKLANIRKESEVDEITIGMMRRLRLETFKQKVSRLENDIIKKSSRLNLSNQLKQLNLEMA